ADSAAIYFDKHALEMKRLPNLDPVDVKNAFGQGTEIFSDKNLLTEFLQMEYSEFDVILLMSSGTFGGLDLNKLFQES
ncbi:MAG: UDP-N-acetylmuramate: L-alanyl-gamma-D-glutamyl-meso-diaminopimelate ligase, partial [Saprospiraceae bacterium]